MVDVGLQEQAMALFEGLFRLEPDQDEFGNPKPKLVPVTPGGKALFVEFYDGTGRQIEPSDEDVSAAFAKLPTHAARLALVLHMPRVVMGQAGMEIDEVSMSGGIALANWFGAEAERIYGLLREDPATSLARRLTEFIARQGGVVTVRDVYTGFRPCKKGRHEAEAALDNLVSAGLGEWVDGAGQRAAGSQAGRFRLTDACLRLHSSGKPHFMGGSEENAADTADTADMQTDVPDDVPDEILV